VAQLLAEETAGEGVPGVETEVVVDGAGDGLSPLMKSGGFIPSVDHQTPPGVSFEQYRMYLRLLKEYTQAI
jgi:hypothetical protein